MSTVTLTVTVKTDDNEWANEYGLATSEAREHFTETFTQPDAIAAIEHAVAGITGGPVLVRAVARTR